MIVHQICTMSDLCWHFTTLLVLVICVHAVTQRDYHHQREHVLKKRLQYGAELSLDKDEKLVDKFLLHYKKKEIENGIKTETFPPAKSFFLSKPLIEASQVFKIIKSMPKGAALHLHDIAMVDPAWITKHLTYKSHCYVCLKERDILSFTYSRTIPPERSDCSWALTEKIRHEFGADNFDDLVIHHLTIIPDNMYTFDSCCVDQNEIWQRAEKAFTLLIELIFVQPNLGEFWEQALTEFRDDGCLFVEPRSLIFPTTDVDGKIYPPEYYLKVYQQVTEKFVSTNPNFLGAKLIKCDLKFMDVKTINQSLNLVMELMKEYPNLLAGYDLVGQEDKSIPLEQYLDALLYPSQMSPPVRVPFYFHAGETDWCDTVIDRNLVDAILLNSTRIGHGYSLVKHPHLLKLVKERNIAVEINPISNQVLGLVSDLRNHPVAQLLALDVSVVVSSDDPSIWRSLPMSHDFYQVFMASTGMTDGLRVLKKLVLNSIAYSSMDEEQKSRAYHVFHEHWRQWISKVIREFPINE